MSEEDIHLLLLYFNSVLGPEIIFTFPGKISEEIGKRIRSFFDLNIDDQFFEITIKKANIKITNILFEIPSQWGRGDVELVMLSLVTDENDDTKVFQEVLMDYSYKIKTSPDIYKAFYDQSQIDGDIILMNRKKAELKELLLECFENLVSRRISGMEGGKIVQKFKRLSW